MIEVIVSNSNCPHCETQKTIMKDSFYSDEYKLIQIGSQEFEALEQDVKEQIDAVPFILVRDEDGDLRYADKGNVEAIKLRRILNAEKRVFNYRTARQAS